MKTVMKTVTMMILTTGLMLLSAEADSKKIEKKNPPKNRRVAQEMIKKSGGVKHMPSKIKFSQLGSEKVGETYYHVYVGKTEKKGYYVYVFDNTPRYLGYYKVVNEPIDFVGGKKEGGILISLEDSDTFDNLGNEDSDVPNSEKIRIKEKTGPVDNTKIDNLYIKFIPAPKKKVSLLVKKDNKAVKKPVYREWTITKQGKTLKVRAIFLKRVFGNVQLRGEASGNAVWLPTSSISEADKKYIEQYPLQKKK